MFNFTFSKDPIKLGEYDQKFGQAFWAEVSEDLKPVKFNLLEPLPAFRAGDKITCEESLNKRSSKGTDYLQLKKVKKVEDESHKPQGFRSTDPLPTEAREAHAASQQTQLDRIEAKIDKLLGIGSDVPASDDGFPDYTG